MSLLGVLLDCESLVHLLSSIKSGTRKSDVIEVNFHTIITNIIIFLHSYCLSNRENRLIFIAHGFSGNHILFPNLNDEIQSNAINFIPWLPDLSNIITQRLSEIFNIEIEYLKKKEEPQRNLSSALSSAITIIRQQQQLFPSLQSRVLVLQFDKDKAQNYNAVMNCIFR
jgi:hypothetical protein